jgi:hypothetical protein
MTRPPNPTMVTLGLAAFTSARARFAQHDWTTASMYAPLAEVVWWAICVDEELERGPGYRAKRNRDPDGKRLVGLRYVRSALGHHMFFNVIVDRGSMLPATLPMRLGPPEARWMPSDMLPIAGVQQKVRRDYDADVAGREISETLACIANWFAQQSPA